jgi:ribosomal 50S subunit-recycling heat shock protein
MSRFVYTKDLTHEHVKVGAIHIKKHERVVCAKYVNVKSAPTIFFSEEAAGVRVEAAQHTSTEVSSPIESRIFKFF